jgi:hypothetical protein
MVKTGVKEWRNSNGDLKYQPFVGNETLGWVFSDPLSGSMKCWSVTHDRPALYSKKKAIRIANRRAEKLDRVEWYESD